MNNRFTCALDGVSPESISPAVRVTDLTELSPRTRVTVQPTARHGLRLLRRVRESLTVRITLVIAEYDPAQRRAALSAVSQWAARGGWLTVSDRPGQRLRVDYSILPAMGALGWSDELQLDCVACTDPFWEEETETEVFVTDESEGAMSLGGTGGECPVHAEVFNVGDAPLTALTLRCGDTMIAFEQLELAPGAALMLEESRGVLLATAMGKSVLMHRTAASSDLLLAESGRTSTLSAAADQPVDVTFRARGRFL